MPTDDSKTDERPRWRRSALWDRADKIRELIERGYSYAQIVRMLRLPVGPRRLCTFCVTQLGIKSLRPSRHDRTRSSATARSAQPTPPPTASAASAPPKPAPSISDALGPEPADEWAAYRKPDRREDRP